MLSGLRSNKRLWSERVLTFTMVGLFDIRTTGFLARRNVTLICFDRLGSPSYMLTSFGIVTGCGCCSVSPKPLVAAQQYKRDHGCFPSGLTTLVKQKYLTEIPLDAIQQTKTLIQYHHTATQTIVYGLGENGIDDGGNVVFVIDSGNDFDPRADDYGYILEKRK